MSTSVATLLSSGASPSRSFKSSTSSSSTSVPPTTEPPTRTVAVLAGACAKVHKLGVESKITAAGFDILLARTEEWKFPDEVDFIEAFLDGHTDEAERKWTDRLTTGPIHFMVLEKPRAVEAWQELMGRCEDNDYQADCLDHDVSFKSIQKSLSQSAIAPTAKLRQTYGVNLLYGSISREQAARQIAICAPE
ncbi:unnamed protein product [Jaminaea pallidilutea]